MNAHMQKLKHLKCRNNLKEDLWETHHPKIDNTLGLIHSVLKKVLNNLIYLPSSNSGLGDTLFSYKQFWSYSHKGPENVKVRSLYRGTGRVSSHTVHGLKRSERGSRNMKNSRLGFSLLFTRDTGWRDIHTSPIPGLSKTPFPSKQFEFYNPKKIPENVK